MYLATTTHSDIAYTVGVLTRFNSNPGWACWLPVKHLLHYIKGTLDHCITYFPDPLQPEVFITFSDADHGGCKDTGCSTGGYVVKMDTGAVSCSSKLQNVVALSTTEAEYITAVQASKEIKWMCNLMHELVFLSLVPLLCSLTTNLQFPWPRTQNTMAGWSNWICAATGLEMWSRSRL